MVSKNKFFTFPARLTPPPPWLPVYKDQVQSQLNLKKSLSNMK